MTDDLADRLGEEQLIERLGVGPEPEDAVYADDGFVTSSTPSIGPQLHPVRLIFTFVNPSNGAVDTVQLDGELRSLSFGKGWLISLETEQDVVPIVAKAAQFGFSEVHVDVNGIQYVMKGELDCTTTFVPGGASLTVTADEASYV